MKVQLMKIEVGVWIDHKQAVIVTSVDQVKQLKRIISDNEAPVVEHLSALPDDTMVIRRAKQNERVDDPLSNFFGEVIAYLSGADYILLFGPGEAKTELQKHLEDQSLGRRIVDVETIGQMTDDQIVAKVQNYFWQLAKSDASPD